MVAKYFIAETNANESVNNHNLWEPTKAKTLASAKGIASRTRSFHGTALHIAVLGRLGNYIPIAIKRADAINMNIEGEWEELNGV